MPKGNSLIVLSALVVGGLYAYRWLAGGKLEGKGKGFGNLIGLGSQISPEGFLIAWGAIFLGLSLLAEANSGLANALALLILITNVMTNFDPISKSLEGLQIVKSQESASPKNVSESGNLLPTLGEALGSGPLPGDGLPPAPSQVKVHTIDWAGLKKLILSGVRIDVPRAVEFLRKGGTVAELERAGRKARRKIPNLAPNLETALNQSA